MQYASLWIKNAGSDWALWRDMTSGIYQNKFNKLTADGMRPTSISSYAVNGQVLYAAAFIKNTDNISWAARHGQSAQQHQETFNALSGQGYRMTSVSGASLNGNAGYSSIWVKNTNNLGWSTRHGLTADQHAAYFQEMKDQGYRPISISVFTLNGAGRYSSVWVKNDGTAWAIYRDQTSAQYQAKFNELSNDGMRPLSISAYPLNGEVRYASAWVKNTNGTDWAARHGLTSEQDLKAFTQLRGQGYRPLCVCGVDPSLAAQVPTPTVGSLPEVSSDGKVRIDLGSFKSINQWRLCPSNPLSGSFHVFGDTRDNWINLWLEVKHPTIGQIIDTVRNCAVGSAAVALGVAVATEGAAVPAAKAAFLAAFKLCLQTNLGALASQVQAEVGWDSETGDWSGH